MDSNTDLIADQEANIATMYETKGFNIGLKHKEQKHSDGSSMTLYELSLDWSDTEFEELISKYK